MLGSQLILTNLASIFIPALILSFFILFGNSFIVFVLMNIFGYRRRVSFFTGLTVAQISEFSLILIALGFSLGYLKIEFVSLITLVGIITIAGSTYFFLYAEKVYSFLKPILRFLDFRKNKKFVDEKELKDVDLVIFGHDRVGYDFVTVAQKMGINYAVVDFSPKVIEKLKNNNINCFFGDAEDVDFLDEINLPKAKMVVSTIPDFKTNLNLVSFYRNHNISGIIIVISHTIKDTIDFYQKGASFVVMPHYLGAKYAAQMIENYAFEISSFEKEKKNHLEYLEKRKKFTG
jgi:hypothetical protein